MTQDLAIVDSRLRPAEAEAIALALTKLLIANLDFPPADWSLSLPVYVEGLDDLPLDLVERAIRLSIRGNPKFPTVAALRALVVDDLERRLRAREEMRAEIAGRALPAPQRPRISPEEVDSVLRKHGVEPRISGGEAAGDGARLAATPRPLSEILHSLHDWPKIPVPGDDLR